MKIISKYILREIFGPFLIGFGFFTFILILNPIIQLVDLLIVKRAPIWECLLLFVYYLPSTVAISLPMATLLAVLMAYGRLSSDSEVIAMRASGIDYWRVFYPAIIISIIISIFGVVFNDTLLPKGNFAAKNLYKEIAQRKPLTQIDEHTLTDISSKDVFRHIGVDKIDQNDIMHGIVIHQRNKNNNSAQVIIAKTGHWLKSVEKKEKDGRIFLIMRLLLENGSIQEPNKENLNDFSHIPFKKFIVNIPQEIAVSINVAKGSREKTTKELMTEIKESQPRILEGIKNKWTQFKNQLNSHQSNTGKLVNSIDKQIETNKKMMMSLNEEVSNDHNLFAQIHQHFHLANQLLIEINKQKKLNDNLINHIAKQKRTKWKPHRLLVEYHKRFSIPFAALAFVLVGLPFSIVSGRSGKSVSLGVSIIIIFFYYIFYILGESLGKDGSMNELVALWIPNWLFIVGGLYYIYRVAKT